MTTANLDHYDQSNAQTGGVVHEEVLKEIADHSNIELELVGRLGVGDTKNKYASWLTDEYEKPSTDLAVVDGADLTGNDATVEERVGNYTQIMPKVVQVSTAAQKSGTIGYRDALTRNIMRRQVDLRRSLNASLYINQGSVAGDGDTVPGRFGALPSWLYSNVESGATAVDGGFQHGAGAEGVTAARTPGTARGLTHTIYDDHLEKIYNNNGNPTVSLMRPTVKRNFGSYLTSDTAQIATLWSEQGKDARGATAANSVSIYVDQYENAIELCPDRLLPEQVEDGGVSDLFTISPEYLDIIYLYQWQAEKQGKTGLSDKWQLHSQMTLAVRSEKAHGAVYDIDESVAVVA